MIKIYAKCLLFFFIAFIQIGPLVANEHAKTAHKPPILTTTAIIEVYDQANSKGLF